MMDKRKLYRDLDALQGELQQQLLDAAARELEVDPVLRSTLDPELIQTIAAVQAVKDYLATRR